MEPEQIAQAEAAVVEAEAEVIAAEAVVDATVAEAAAESAANSAMLAAEAAHHVEELAEARADAAIAEAVIGAAAEVAETKEDLSWLKMEIAELRAGQQEIREQVSLILTASTSLIPLPEPAPTEATPSQSGEGGEDPEKTELPPVVETEEVKPEEVRKRHRPRL
jgi:hypothetical protein